MKQISLNIFFWTLKNVRSFSVRCVGKKVNMGKIFFAVTTIFTKYFTRHIDTLFVPIQQMFDLKIDFQKQS